MWIFGISPKQWWPRSTFSQHSLSRVTDELRLKTKSVQPRPSTVATCVPKAHCEEPKVNLSSVKECRYPCRQRLVCAETRVRKVEDWADKFNSSHAAHNLGQLYLLS